MRKIANRVWLSINAVNTVLLILSVIGTAGSIDLNRISNGQAVIQIALVLFVGMGTWISEAYRRATFGGGSDD